MKPKKGPIFTDGSLLLGVEILKSDSELQDAVIYARYSSHAQKDTSIEDQVADCEAYAKLNNLRIMKIYADRHLSRMLPIAAGSMLWSGKPTGSHEIAMTAPPINID